ncbi:MAG: DUF1566 domain-containing protein [Cocleimonas sp.]
MKNKNPKLCALFFSLFVLSNTSYAELDVVNTGLVNDTVLNTTWMKDANLFNALCKANNPIAMDFFPPSSDKNRQITDANAICSRDGRMTWSNAQGWIDRLNQQNYLGHNDWRLPTTNQPDGTCEYQTTAQGLVVSGGYNCIGKEFSHLFNASLDNPNHAGTGAMGGKIGSVCADSIAQPQFCFQNTAPFSNTVPITYWSESSAAGAFLETNNTFNEKAAYKWTFNTKSGYQGSKHRGFDEANVWPIRSGLSEGNSSGTGAIISIIQLLLLAEE